MTRKLAKIKEDEGNVSEAAEILQEVQVTIPLSYRFVKRRIYINYLFTLHKTKVETYGAMDPREKIEFILEQMRLCLAKNDSTRAQIISRKVTAKALDNPAFQVECF